MARSNTGHIIYWVALFTGANLLVKGSYFLVVFLLASVLTPDIYASFGFLFALQGAMTTLATVGLQETTAARLKMYSSWQRRRLLYRRISELFVFTALLALLMLLPFAALMVYTNTSFTQTISAVLLGAVGGYAILQASFKRLDSEYVLSLIYSAGVPFCSIIGLMIGGWWARDLTLVFILGLAGAILPLAILILRRELSMGSIPTLRLIHKEFSSLGPFMIMAIFGWLSGYGMNFIIDLRFETFYVATFTFLFTAASVSQMIANSLNMAWSPGFYKLFNEGAMNEAEDRNRLFFNLLAIVLGLVGCIAVAFLPWLTDLIGGQLFHYGGFRLELALLISGYIICIPWWYGQNYYHVAGYSSALMHLSLWSGGVGLVFWIICMVLLGPVGIFIGFTLQMAIKAGAMWVIGNHHWRLRPPWVAIIISCALTFSGLLFPVT